MHFPTPEKLAEEFEMLVRGNQQLQEQWNAIDNEYEEKVCKERNKGLIKSATSLQGKGQHKFIIGGSSHFFPPRLHNEPASIDEIKEGECPYELAKHLKTQNYVTLMPK